jgi:hypothetical protein
MWDNILSETVVVREELNMVEWAGAVLGGLKALPGVMTIAEKHRCARIARDLATLRFWCDGMAVPLRHIAEGGCSQADLDEIDAGLQQTKTEITKVARRLRKAREGFVATKLGMDLDVVIYEKLGPGSIRPQLEHLVETKDCSAEKATEGPPATSPAFRAGHRPAMLLRDPIRAQHCL